MNKTLSKRIHNWAGLLSAVFLAVLLVTGVLLNHPHWVEKDATASLLALPDGVRWLAGRKSGLYFSDDRGRTWEELSMLYPLQEVVGLSLEPGSIGTVYALERWGRLVRSRDGGRVWEDLPLPFDPQTSGVELKAVSAAPGGGVLLLTSHGWLASADGKDWDAREFHPQRRPALRTVKLLHNGYFFGPKFFWLYDAAAFALLVLIVTGFVLWKEGRKIA